MDYKTIDVYFKKDKAIVTVKEKRIYLGITDLFREDMLALLEHQSQELIMNLSEVAVMNSAGLGVLIMARDMIKKRNGRVKITHLQPLMQDIFSRMRLDTLFEIYPDMEEALAH
ncbi:MAG: STAS domain-containing protein [Candidatus Zhuqueibacterota bacterium]